MSNMRYENWIEYLFGIAFMAFFASVFLRVYSRFDSMAAALLVCGYGGSALLVAWLASPRVKRSKEVISEEELGAKRLTAVGRNRGLIVCGAYLLITSAPFFYLIERYFL